MATTIRTDPLRNFKFQVHITYQHDAPMARLGFMSVSGLSMNTEMIPYREGGMNTVTKKMPGQSDYPQVSFQRGLFAGQNNLFNWFKDIFFIDKVNGHGGLSTDFRATVTIRVLAHPSVHLFPPDGGGGSQSVTTQSGVQVFGLIAAWPTALAWSDLDAGGNGIIMEQMTLAHEGLVPIYGSSGQAAGFTFN